MNDIEENYENLMEQYYDKLYSYIYRTSYDKSLVEDILQETFLEAFLKSEVLFNHPKPVGWLYKVAQFKIKELNRKNSKLLFLDDVSNESAVDHNFRRVELDYDLKMAISKEEIEILNAYYVDGYTGKEIAKALDISDGNFKVKVHRIKTKLKKEWKGEDY